MQLKVSYNLKKFSQKRKPNKNKVMIYILALSKLKTLNDLIEMWVKKKD